MEDLGEAYDWSTKTNAQKELIGSPVDWEMLQYNSVYNSVQFYDKKFPKGYENIPGFDKIIEQIAEQSAPNSPLAEYNMRCNIKENE